MLQEDGTVKYGPAVETTKIWLGQIADAYANGWITPNITQDTSREEEMADANFGLTYSWIAWNNPDAAPMVSFYAKHPDAKWETIEMVEGDNGTPQETPSGAGAWAYFGITDQCEDPERLYAIWDDMVEIDNYMLRRWGKEGEHYTIDENGNYNPIVHPTSQENLDQNIGLYLLIISEIKD